MAYRVVGVAAPVSEAHSRHVFGNSLRSSTSVSLVRGRLDPPQAPGRTQHGLRRCGAARKGGFTQKETLGMRRGGNARVGLAATAAVILFAPQAASAATGSIWHMNEPSGSVMT